MSVKVVWKIEAENKNKVRLLSLLKALKDDAEKFKTSKYKVSYIYRFNKLRDAVIEVYKKKEGNIILRKTVKELTPKAHWPTIIGSIGQIIAFLENDLEGVIRQNEDLTLKIQHLKEENLSLENELQDLRNRVKFIK